VTFVFNSSPNLASTTMAEGYKIQLLPKSHHDLSVWTQIIERQKLLRLQSLQLSPESFSSTYAREAIFTEKDWQARLQNPLAFTFVAVCPPGETTEGLGDDYLLNGAWVGMVVLIGPFIQIRSLAQKDLGHEEKGEEQRPVRPHYDYHINGLIVLPHARRLGLGKALLKLAIDHADAFGRKSGAAEINIKLSVSSGNSKALILYQKVGFQLLKDGKDALDDRSTTDMACRYQYLYDT
jgi:ribosomal protein S18 acetylase RimI-like enzyme